MGLDPSQVRRYQGVRGQLTVAVGHAHLGEDPGNRLPEPPFLYASGLVLWDLEPLKQSNLLSQHTVAPAHAAAGGYCMPSGPVRQQRGAYPALYLIYRFTEKRCLREVH